MSRIKRITPSTLSFITTHRCTSSCPNCCFNCSPAPLNRKEMTRCEMREYISQSIQAFPNIGMVIFTGGECTLLKEDLLDAIQFASKHGLATRVVTNGHWAKTDESTDEMINKLVAAGLTEINFSTGDEHVQYVPLDRIIRAVKKCAENTAFASVVINIEGAIGNRINKKTIMSSPAISSLPKETIRKIICLQSIWIPFRKRNPENTSQNRTGKRINADSHKGCAAVLNSININPNGQFLSCCGLSSEYSPFLKLGQVQNNIEALHDLRFDDIMKIWLYTAGPLNILKKIGGDIGDGNKHMCEYCLELFMNKQNLERLLNIDSDEINNILLDYSLKTSRL